MGTKIKEKVNIGTPFSFQSKFTCGKDNIYKLRKGWHLKV